MILMRALMPHFFRRDQRRKSFVLFSISVIKRGLPQGLPLKMLGLPQGLPLGQLQAEPDEQPLAVCQSDNL